MKNYFLVMKLLLKNMFAPNPHKKRSAAYAPFIVLGILYLMVEVLLILVVSAMAPMVKNMSLVSEALTMIFGIVIAMVMILSIIAILNTLYFSKDTEFFLSLPIGASTVYFAKMSIVILTNLVIEAILLLPLLLTFGISASMPVIFYLISLLAVLTLPIIPILIASILAIPLMYIVSFFKNKGALTSIVLILLFAVVMVGYMSVVMNLAYSQAGGADFNPEQFIIEFKQSFIIVSNILFPLSALAKVAAGVASFGLNIWVSGLINVLIYVAFMAALMLIGYLISSGVYKRGAAAQLEGAKSKKKAPVKDYAGSNALMALIKKEWKELTRTPAFAFQCLSGIILCPIIIVIMGMSTGMGAMAGMDMAAEDIALMNSMMSVMMIMMVLLIGVSMGSGSSSSISREGDKFYFSKTLPVEYKTLVKAKQIFHTALSSLTIIVSSIIAAIIGKDWLFSMLGMVFILIYNYGFVSFTIYYDLSHPKLDWKTPNEAVKNSKNVMVPMFINMGIGAIFIVLAMVGMAFGMIGQLLFWVFAFAVAIVACCVFPSLLKTHAQRLYERIEV